MQYDRPRALGCEPVDGVLVVLSSYQLNIATFVHQMGDVAIFVWFELRTTSTPSTGSHLSTLGLSCWPKFFLKISMVHV